VNTYWRHTVRGGKFKKAKAMVFLSEQGERYRTHAILSMNVQRVPRHALKGRLAVHITAYPPDRRARDLDNLPKGVLDALEACERHRRRQLHRRPAPGARAGACQSRWTSATQR
jgi:Holliday junction resolvase RusA-like endonuclease